MQAHLRKLNDIDDIAVASGDPDPRGWSVRAADGREIGHVKDLIVDTEAMKARYLDVVIDTELLRSHDQHLMVPTDAITIGDRERHERQITVPMSPEVIAAATVQGDVPIDDRVAGDRWPRAERDVCNVRVTRGGRNG